MYLRFYGLSEQPFSITPDPRFLLYTRHHKEAYEHVLYGIESRKGFIQLTGEVGAGKTTICRAILSNMKADIRTALILNPCLTGNQLLRAILNDFGLNAKGRDRLAFIDTLNCFLLEQVALGCNVALIIDEAQDLSAELLEQVRLLSNLETDRHKLLQIVLCGQPELQRRLDTPELRQLRQRIAIRCHLRPLTEEETRHYIEHRLRTAGWKGGELFATDAVHAVHSYAAGVPRLTNALCDVALLAGYAAQIGVIDVACVKRGIRQLEGKQVVSFKKLCAGSSKNRKMLQTPPPDSPQSCRPKSPCSRPASGKTISRLFGRNRLFPPRMR